MSQIPIPVPWWSPPSRARNGLSRPELGWLRASALRAILWRGTGGERGSGGGGDHPGERNCGREEIRVRRTRAELRRPTKHEQPCEGPVATQYRAHLPGQARGPSFSFLFFFFCLRLTGSCLRFQNFERLPAGRADGRRRPDVLALNRDACFCSHAVLPPRPRCFPPSMSRPHAEKSRGSQSPAPPADTRCGGVC